MLLKSYRFFTNPIGPLRAFRTPKPYRAGSSQGGHGAHRTGLLPCFPIVLLLFFPLPKPGRRTAGHLGGGAKEDRTPDLLRARQALSQLSYGPGSSGCPDRRGGLRAGGAAGVVGLGGFEPPTSPLSGVRSNQLSYRPVPVS